MIIPILIVAAVVILKAVDYGWTAYDAYQSTQTLSNPNATEADKSAAAANLAMTVVFEAIEPDDLLPVSLPLDDLARKGVIKVGKEASWEAGERAFKSFTRRNFRDNLITLTGKSLSEVVGKEAHHVLPQEFYKEFKKLGSSHLTVC